MNSHINKFLISEYQAASNLKDSTMQRLDEIEARFIANETPRYKQRMLDIYSKVAPNRHLALKDILSGISYGPVALHGISLTDNNKTYIGSVLYYRHRFVPVFDSGVMMITYMDDNREVIKLYKQSLNETTKMISDEIPLHWMVGLEELEGGFEALASSSSDLSNVDADMRLIAFLSQNVDIATFGDLHMAITDYYDIREKLSGANEYYWVSQAAVGNMPVAVNTAQLVEQLREATETYTNDSVHDLQNSDWQCIQSLLQKALIALQ